jgi:hypothetical protein
MALYRTAKPKNVLHNTQPSEPWAQESKKAESPGIIEKNSSRNR